MCGCARVSRTWNFRCAARSTRASEIAASANDRIRHVTIAKRQQRRPARRLRQAARMEARRARDHRAISRLPATTSRAICRRPSTCRRAHRLGLGWLTIEPWMSDRRLRSCRGNERRLTCRRNMRTDPSVARFTGASTGRSGGVSAWRDWRREPWATNDAAAAAWQRAPRSSRTGKTGAFRARARYDGMVWYRAHVKLSRAQAKQAATLVARARSTMSISSG